jgi:hypothetical protein
VSWARLGGEIWVLRLNGFFIIMSYFDNKQIFKPGKVMVPRSVQREKDKEKGLSFIRKKDNRVRVRKPVLDKAYMRKGC